MSEHVFQQAVYKRFARKYGYSGTEGRCARGLRPTQWVLNYGVVHRRSRLSLFRYRFEPRVVRVEGSGAQEGGASRIVSPRPRKLDAQPELALPMAASWMEEVRFDPAMDHSVSGWSCPAPASRAYEDAEPRRGAGRGRPVYRVSRAKLIPRGDKTGDPDLNGSHSRGSSRPSAPDLAVLRPLSV